jgi:hypothetical protein
MFQGTAAARSNRTACRSWQTTGHKRAVRPVRDIIKKKMAIPPRSMREDALNFGKEAQINRAPPIE